MMEQVPMTTILQMLGEREVELHVLRAQVRELTKALEMARQRPKEPDGNTAEG